MKIKTERTTGAVKAAEHPELSRVLKDLQADHIVYGIPKERAFGILRVTPPIKDIIANPKLTTALVSHIRNYVLPHMRNGEVILNNNIPPNILKEVGLKPTQYNNLQLIGKENRNRKKGKRLGR
ncbi:hypothetical protein [Chitinophaga japonensis]|nr:hypothetical protein [Chitinophaga japonensis]